MRAACAVLIASAACAVVLACQAAPAASPVEHPASRPAARAVPTPAADGPEAPASTPASAQEAAPAATSLASASAIPLPEATFRNPLPEGQTEEERLSFRIASLSPAQCRAELTRRKLPVARESRATPGVATPVRLTDTIGGVRFITPGKRSVYGIFDCRLVVLLDELVKVLIREGVAAVHVDNAYRPKAHLPGRRKKSQHAYGLAIDLYGFTLTDGTALVVDRDFAGAIRTPVCGPLATVPDEPKAILLRNVTCAIARARIFNYLLTPNFDAAHRDHLHADIQRGTRARVVK